VIEQKNQSILWRCRVYWLGTVGGVGYCQPFLDFSPSEAFVPAFSSAVKLPELRPYYPMHTMRVLIQCLIVGAILFESFLH